MKESGKERLKYVVYESTRALLRVNLYKGQCPIKNHSRPFHWKGADERSEAGLASPRGKIPLHAANLRTSGHFLPKEGGRKVE